MSQTPNIPPQWQRYADSAYQQGQAEAQARLQQAPPPQYTYAEPRSERGRGASAIEGLNANVMTIISAIAFVVWATYFGTTQFQSLQSGQERTSEKIDRTAVEIKNLVSNYTTSTSERIKRLEEELKVRAASRLSKSDMEIWCAKTERLNIDIKWRCGPIVSQMTGTVPPIWENALPAWATTEATQHSGSANP